MTRKERMDLIENIQNVRGSKVVVYITGDRPNLVTQIGTDIFPFLHQHLASGGADKIDLFLYRLGGDTMAGYALVNLFREFCNEFNVIIPFRALSCATLIALGANEVVMTKTGQLSPIDPSLSEHPLAPVVELPNRPRAVVPINVEDVNAFLDLAKEEFKLNDEQSMLSVFDKLSSKIDPIVLGAVQRSRQQIAFLATKLMEYHTKDEQVIEKCVRIVTRERFSHSYIISKTEAEQTLKLNVIEPTGPLNASIMMLNGLYREMLKLDVPYFQTNDQSDPDWDVANLNLGILESMKLTHVCRPVINQNRQVIAGRWLEDLEL